MADQKTETQAAKADEPKKTEAPAAAKAAEAAPVAAAKSAEKAVKAAPAAAATAAPKARAAKVAKPARRAAPKRAKAAPARARATARKTINRTNHSINEGTRTMKKEANQMADRMQAVFGDYNERAKSSLERSARFGEELTELSKGNVEALVASTKIAARGVETIGQEVADRLLPSPGRVRPRSVRHLRRREREDVRSDDQARRRRRPAADQPLHGRRREGEDRGRRVKGSGRTDTSARV
jgi:hypothetical protein